MRASVTGAICSDCSLLTDSAGTTARVGSR
jgi:hypothetical protein